MKIWVSGSIARDIIMDFPGRFRDFIDPKKIHMLSLSFAVENLKENYGGTAANICYNLALLEEKPAILGRVGIEGIEIKHRLRKFGVDVGYLGISKTRSTASAYIITDRDDNQIAGFHAGAMLEPAKLPKVKKADWAIIAAENPKNMVKLAQYYARQKVNYLFDPGQQITALSKKDLEICIRGAKVLIGNDYEIGHMTRTVVRLGGSDYRAVIVRTLGPKGSEIYAGDRKIKIGIAKPKRVLDPTGAGDAYRAGFLKGLILGYNLKTCGELGATTASFAVEEHGTQKHRFRPKELIGRYRANFSRGLLI